MPVQLCDGKPLDRSNSQSVKGKSPSTNSITIISVGGILTHNEPDRHGVPASDVVVGEDIHRHLGHVIRVLGPHHLNTLLIAT